MQQPFMTKVCAPIAGVIPKSSDVEMWIKGIRVALKATNRERPQSEVTKRDRAERQKKLKIMLAEFQELKTMME